MTTIRLRALLASTALAAFLATGAIAQDIEAEIVPLGELDYEGLYTEGMSVEDLLDAAVTGPTGDDIGEVENVLFDQDGRVLSIIAEVGGFLEMGDTHVNVPWDRVEILESGEELMIPLTQDRIEDYTLLTDDYVTATDASSDLEEVGGDNAGVVGTGPQVWRATDLIGDTARLREGDGYVGYGYVDDLILRDGMIAAVVANPDAGLGLRGPYAYPYRTFEPGLGTYDLPYGRADIEGLEPFDDDRLDG